jgi:hypothetical protein
MRAAFLALRYELNTAIAAAALPAATTLNGSSRSHLEQQRLEEAPEDRRRGEAGDDTGADDRNASPAIRTV